jgi:hypothetical protein
MTALEATLSRLGASEEGGYVLPDFYGARGNWERIRAEYFQDAPWYHAPMPPPEVGVGAGGAAAGAREDPAAFHQANAFASDLERIVNAYRSTLLGFPDRAQVRTMTPGQARQLQNDYRAFFTRWNDELDAAQRLGPEGWYRVGRESAAKLQRATTELTRAFNALRSAVPPSGIAPRDTRASNLNTATTAILNARRALSAP